MKAADAPALPPAVEREVAWCSHPRKPAGTLHYSLANVENHRGAQTTVLWVSNPWCHCPALTSTAVLKRVTATVAGWGILRPTVVHSSWLQRIYLIGLLSRKCTFPLTQFCTHRSFQDPLNLSKFPKVKSSDLKTIHALDILGSFMKVGGTCS